MEIHNELMGKHGTLAVIAVALFLKNSFFDYFTIDKKAFLELINNIGELFLFYLFLKRLFEFIL